MKKVEINDNIAFYAFRYALGRKTYAVQHTVEYLWNNWFLLLPNTQATIQKEIEEAIDNNTIGMDMDKAAWSKLLQLPIVPLSKKRFDRKNQIKVMFTAFNGKLKSKIMYFPITTPRVYKLPFTYQTIKAGMFTEQNLSTSSTPEEHFIGIFEFRSKTIRDNVHIYEFTEVIKR